MATIRAQNIDNKGYRLENADGTVYSITWKEAKVQFYDKQHGGPESIRQEAATNAFIADIVSKLKNIDAAEFTVTINWKDLTQPINVAIGPPKTIQIWNNEIQSF